MDSAPVKDQAAILRKMLEAFPHMYGALQMAHNFFEASDDNSPEALQTLAAIDEALEAADAALGRA